METSRTVDVATLDTGHRRAIEDVIGVQLRADQRLTIGVTEPPVNGLDEPQLGPPTLADWQSLYEGLTDEQIELIDRIANTRACGGSLQ